MSGSDAPGEDPACDNRIDDDGDGRPDHPADPDCNARYDPSEVADCGDSIASDLDGAGDFPADSGCNDRADPTEELDCSDGRDNDGDGPIDLEDDGCPDPGNLDEESSRGRPGMAVGSLPHRHETLAG